MTMDQAHSILDFWFGKLPLDRDELEQRMAVWFADSRKDRRLDHAIRDRFGDAMQRAASGELDSWASSPRRSLALILLLDQFPRNVYRGGARAFATDARALETSLTGIEQGADGALDPIERFFYYMPLQHAESLEVQEQAVTLFTRLTEEAAPALRDLFASSAKYALKHRDIVQRFGRFPHRNRALGRASTPEEIRYIADGGDTFGQ